MLSVHAASLILTVACSGGNDPAGGDAAGFASRPDPGVVHVHGLGLNPKDGSLFAATHTGLFRITEGRAERVGNRYQDTMGFTVVGPDRFLGSGHPELRDYTSGKLPGLLGLIESKDAGRSWKPQPLLGEADFHILAFAHGRFTGSIAPAADSS